MATPELNKALAAFQADLPKIPKNAKGEIRGTTKDGKAYSYTFDYASLEDVTDETLPALGRHGLALTGAVTTDDQGRIVYEYTLLHESGEERGPSQFPLWLLLPDRFTAQTIGGYITYARRYIVGPVTGIAPGGQDIDATGTDESGASGGRWMNRRLDVPPANLPRTPTKTTGAGHEQLRAGTVEAGPGDRPARRSRVPNGSDPWQDAEPGALPPNELAPEETEGTLDGRQRSQIMAKLGRLPRDERLGRLADIIGHEVDSANQLSQVEAGLVIKTLDAEAKAAAEVAP